MTTIKLALNDQRLFATNKVTLASGDINSVQLEVEFCEAWADYPVRFAHFAVQTANRLILSSETDAIPDVLMIDNKAIVPATALAESGVLYVGVYGDSLDGTARKTSIGEVKFIIHKGASGAKTTIAPETDAFMQYLAAMDDKIDPLMKAAVEQMQNTMAAQYKTFTDKVAADLEEFKNQYVEGVVLWECPDIESEMMRFYDKLKHENGLIADAAVEETYPIDATKYSKFVVVLQSQGEVHTQYDVWEEKYVPKSVDTEGVKWRVGEIVKNMPQPVQFYDSGLPGIAAVLVTDNSATITINVGSHQTGPSNEAHPDWGCVVYRFPVAIIGYKTPVVEVPDIEFE